MVVSPFRSSVVVKAAAAAAVVVVVVALQAAMLGHQLPASRAFVVSAFQTNVATFAAVRVAGHRSKSCSPHPGTTSYFSRNNKVQVGRIRSTSSGANKGDGAGKASAVALFLMPAASSSDNESKLPPPVVVRKNNHWALLARPHERSLFLLYAFASSAVLCAAAALGGTNSLQLLVAAETGVALTWASMILAISFMEAWVKFKAPFLKKMIAVDVGRHVFAALNAVELALSGSFWASRVWQCYRLNNQQQSLLSATTGFSFLLKNKAYYLQPSFLLPAIATVALLVEVTIVAPRLYLRAKSRIVQGFDEGSLSVKVALTKAEQNELAYISREVDERKKKPNKKRKLPKESWHSVYAVLEVIKVVSLEAFVVLSWIKLLK